MCPPALSPPCALLPYIASVLRAPCSVACALLLLPSAFCLVLIAYCLHVPSCLIFFVCPLSQVQLRGLCTYSLEVGILPISCPSVYKINAPYHKCSLMARAFLFFDDQVQPLAHTHVGSGSNPIVGPFFLDQSTYGWIGQQSSSGLSDLTPATLGVFASLDRF